MSDLDLRKLRYFVVLATELNFSRAAESLHIAQPVLSRQIVALEKELGVELFTRSKKGTTLSPAGEILAKESAALLRAATALQRSARMAARSHRVLTVGFMPGVFATPAIRELSTMFPALEIDVMRTGWDNQVEAIHDGRVDVSFVRLPVDAAGLQITPLYDEPRVVVLPAGHSLLDSESVDMMDLARLPLLQDPDAVPEWRDLAATLDGVRPMVKTKPHPKTVEEKLEHVAAGHGIVVLPESTARFYSRPDIAFRHVRGLAYSGVALARAATSTAPEILAMVEISRNLELNPAGVI